MRLVYYVIRKVRSIFIGRPERKLTWSLEDFRLARRWALCQPDPMGQRSSLWARIYSPRKDSLDIIDEINRLI